MKVPKQRIKDNPKIELRGLKDGRTAIDLVEYLGRVSEPVLNDLGEPVYYEQGKMKGKPKLKVKHLREKETLKYYLITNPTNPTDREHNKQVWEIAKRIRYEKEQQRILNAEGYRIKKDNKNTNLHDWMWSYYEKYTKGDKRHIKRACTIFVDFLEATPEYLRLAKRITPTELTKGVIVDFIEYLQSRFSGAGPHTLYSRFKKIIKEAVEAGVLNANPTAHKETTIKTPPKQPSKEILSEEEIKLLIDTHYQGENINIRNAFLFCLFCGVRWCDVKELTYANVDFANKVLSFEQAKVRRTSSNPWVYIPLVDELLPLIGEPKTMDKRNEKIFPLPSHTMCLKALRHWCKRAGIKKHITWHCARHTAATRLLKRIDINNVAAILGHSNLTITQKYLHRDEDVISKGLTETIIT